MPAQQNTRPLAWLVAGACLALAACETRNAPDADMQVSRPSPVASIPSMDADAPAVTQTATFALG